MWMALDRFKRTKRVNIAVDFYSGMAAMFSVKKYSDALDALRQKRGVSGYFGHDLVSIDTASRKATFKKTSDGSTVDVHYSLLHVTPAMGPLNVFKGSPIADAAGWIPVHKGTMQHVKYNNIFALGDCSSLPTSKTAAAITAQAPILTENLFSFADTGKIAGVEYDGYTSCPVGQISCFSDQYLNLRLIVAYWVRRTNAGRVQVWIGTQRIFQPICRPEQEQQVLSRLLLEIFYLHVLHRFFYHLKKVKIQ